MHERTRLFDELDDRPMTHPDDCTCDACLDLLAWLADVDQIERFERHMLESMDPSDDDLARRDAQIDRGYRHLAAWIAGNGPIFFCLIVLALAGISLHATHAQAQDSTRPVIGTEAYDRSCSIVREWQDATATAWCAEDGALYVYAPSTGTWTPVSTSR